MSFAEGAAEHCEGEDEADGRQCCSLLLGLWSNLICTVCEANSVPG